MENSFRTRSLAWSATLCNYGRYPWRVNVPYCMFCSLLHAAIDEFDTSKDISAQSLLVLPVASEFAIVFLIL